MSAECSEHGCDLVYDGPDMVCRECQLEAQLAAVRKELLEEQRIVSDCAAEYEIYGSAEVWHNRYLAAREALAEAERLSEVRAISIRQHSDSLDSALAKLAEAERQRDEIHALRDKDWVEYRRVWHKQTTERDAALAALNRILQGEDRQVVITDYQEALAQLSQAEAQGD